MSADVLAARAASPLTRLTPALPSEEVDTMVVEPVTVTDLLRERRALVTDLRSERDAATRAFIQFQIDEIDRELVRRAA